MTILAKYAGRIVEVHDVFYGSGGRRVAEVELVWGEPFTHTTHGGPATDNFNTAPIDLIELVNSDCSCEEAKDTCPYCEMQGMIKTAEDDEWITRHSYDHLRA